MKKIRDGIKDRIKLGVEVLSITPVGAPLKVGKALKIIDTTAKGFKGGSKILGGMSDRAVKIQDKAIMDHFNLMKKKRK